MTPSAGGAHRRLWKYCFQMSQWMCHSTQARIFGLARRTSLTENGQGARAMRSYTRKTVHPRRNRACSIAGYIVAPVELGGDGLCMPAQRLGCSDSDETEIASVAAIESKWRSPQFEEHRRALYAEEEDTRHIGDRRRVCGTRSSAGSPPRRDVRKVAAVARTFRVRWDRPAEGGPGEVGPSATTSFNLTSRGTGVINALFVSDSRSNFCGGGGGWYKRGLAPVENG